jgi:acetyl-CoA acyltransferase 1
MAVTTIANQISARQIDVGLAIGVESLSQFIDERPTLSEEIQKHGPANDCGKPMGWTSENVAEDFEITRAQQDEYAAMSFQRAERAQKEGWFRNEIVPFKAFVREQDGSQKEVIVTQDEGIRCVRFDNSRELL